MSSPVIIGPVGPSSGSASPIFSGGPVNQEQAFPALTPSQIDRIRPFGRIRQTTVGEILFEPGDATAHFFVLLSGALEIVQLTLQGERLIVTHQAGSFTGEMTMISGRGALARGRVTAAGEFLELTPEALRNPGGARRGVERNLYAGVHTAPGAADFIWQRERDSAGLTALGEDAAPA